MGFEANDTAVKGTAFKELSADVVVIGGGGAGFAAAIQANQNGASVIILEKAKAVGGNTIRSGLLRRIRAREYLQAEARNDFKLRKLPNDSSLSVKTIIKDHTKGLNALPKVRAKI